MKVYIAIAGDLGENDIFFYNGTVHTSEAEAEKELNVYGGCDTMIIPAEIKFEGHGCGFSLNGNAVGIHGTNGKLTIHGEVYL